MTLRLMEEVGVYLEMPSRCPGVSRPRVCQMSSPRLLSPWTAEHTGPVTKQAWTRQAARQLVAGLPGMLLRANLIYVTSVL